MAAHSTRKTGTAARSQTIARNAARTAKRSQASTLTRSGRASARVRSI